MISRNNEAKMKPLEIDDGFLCKETQCCKNPSLIEDLGHICHDCVYSLDFHRMSVLLKELKADISQYNFMNQHEEREVETLIEKAVKKGEIFIAKTVLSC